MPNIGVAVHDTGRMRVLVVRQDGGIVSELLSFDAGLQVTTVGSLREAERLMAQLRPRVVVLALSDASSERPEALRIFRAAFETTPVLVISNPAPERVVTELFKAGAGGYLFSEEAPHTPNAIRELARGGVPMSQDVSRIVLDRARRSSQQIPAVLPKVRSGSVHLTTRQQQILELLAGGHSYDDIGVALDLSVNTVRWHVKALYDRLGASTKVEAVMIAIEHGLLKES